MKAHEGEAMGPRLARWLHNKGKETIIMATKTSRTDRLAADQKLIDGVQKVLAAVASLTVGSRKVTPADIVKILQERRNTANAASTAEAAHTAAVKADRDMRKQTTPFVSTLRRFLQAMYSESPETLAEFGLKPLKGPKTSVAVKATAQARIKATREARHTMGTQQRRKVKGAATAPATPTKPNTP
jgi:hypothetical protein